MNGGEQVARVLQRHGVQLLFTLCGGHISPILVECKRLGIRVVDVRDEATAVFAADAAARLTGVPGVAAVTAGPGVTNTLTAVQNAAMAQSPVLVLGGATATLLRGRGALQDIDQLSLIRPMVKGCRAAKRVRDLAPAVEDALRVAASGVPGPTFVECPVDLLYGEDLVRSWYVKEVGGKRKDLASRLEQAFVRRHLEDLFATGDGIPEPWEAAAPEPCPRAVAQAARLLEASERPVLVAGSQAVVCAREVDAIAASIRSLGVPTFLGGMARGLLGSDDPLWLRHRRSEALAEADLVLVAGFPFDFRLGYGRKINRKAAIVAANRSPQELRMNRRPTLAVPGDPGRFLQALARHAGGRWDAWLETLRGREAGREEEIAREAAERTELVNPIHLCREIDRHLADDSVLVVDGGDFVATASYVVRPRSPLSWLDPGVFGTLGVGGGFALGAALCRPGAEVWLLYGDGSCAYSLAEFDTFVRHGLPVIAVVGNDASWAQIAREQVEILGDAVGTELRRAAYHVVAEGYGGRGLLLERPEDVPAVLAEAKAIAASGTPVLVNAMIGATDFRKGSLSM